MMEERISRIFQNVERSKSYKNLFFKKLSETTNPFPWLFELQERGYLDPSNNKNLQRIEGENYFKTPYWNILGYIENYSKNISDETDEKIVSDLLNVINSIIEYKEEGKKIDNYYTDWSLIKTLFFLPIKYMDMKYIVFLEQALNNKWNNTLISAEINKTVIPYFIKHTHKNFLLKTLEICIINDKMMKPNDIDVKSIMDDFWLSDLLMKYRKEIIEICGVSIAIVTIDRMDKILKINNGRFNQVLIPAIEDHTQTMFPEKYECQLVYLLRDTLENSDSNLIKNIIMSLINKEHSIYRRMAIHVINHHYDNLKSLFWSWKDNPLGDFPLKHEIYKLLHDQSLSFSTDEYDQLYDWITTIEYNFTERYADDPGEIKILEARYRREWLEALIDTISDPKYLELYDEVRKIFPYEIKHPSFDYWSSGVQIVSSPPLESKLLDLSNEELVDYINSYVIPERESPLDIFSSLFGQIRRCARENSVKFSSNLMPFLNVSAEYQNAILSGLREAWDANQNIDWGELFTFCSELIKQESFWDNITNTQDRYNQLIVRTIGELINNGTNRDDHAFDEEFLPMCEKILLILVCRTNSDYFEMKDIITSVLNSTLGTLYSAMINYSLRYARLFNRESDVRWPIDIKNYFDTSINYVSENIEFQVSLGEYLSHLHYLDKNWLEENINLILPKENPMRWENSFTGYLFYTNNVSRDLFSLLKDNAHYQLAIKTDFKYTPVTTKMVQHVVISYFQGLESLEEDSLLTQLILNEIPSQLSDIIIFLWRGRGKLPDEFVPKIKPLWKTMFEVLSDLEEDDLYHTSIAKLTYWLSLIKFIDDDIFEWVIFSSNFITESDEMFFMEYLLKHVSNTPEKVGNIFLNVLRRKYFPRHKVEYIVGIVQQLFQSGKKDLANRICNIYLDNGYDFLRDLFRENNM